MGSQNTRLESKELPNPIDASNVDLRYLDSKRWVHDEREDGIEIPTL